MKKDLWELKTPCYIIDAEVFQRNMLCIHTAFTQCWGNRVELGYSIKTNHLLWFLKKAKEMGCWAEAVSGDEVDLATKAGFSLERVIFNGPQKKKEDIERILNSGGILNLDNFADVQMLLDQKEYLKYQKPKIGLRINCDLEKLCPGETTAGVDVSRFGFCIENDDFEKAINMLHQAGISVSGFHLHYSTKTRSTRVFEALAHTTVDLICRYSLQQEITYIDLGGGFFGGQKSEKYPSMDMYATAICNILRVVLEPQKVTLFIEPGASVLATAVEYMSEIINARYIRGKRILTLDGSLLHVDPFMTLRLKETLHLPKRTGPQEEVPEQLLCGCTCMEKDRFAKLEQKRKVHVGDRIKIAHTGAYTMAFNSCFINLPPAVYLSADDGYTELRLPSISLLEII
jgi:diaminopimelate decarboxylase